jgi:division protein CdvB (Snf7/Vps24/ESCRT-III family)
MPRKPSIRKGVASHYANDNQNIYDVGDQFSGALISVRRDLDTQQLVIEVYRADSDVVVSAPIENLDPRLVIELNSRALAAEREV